MNLEAEPKDKRTRLGEIAEFMARPMCGLDRYLWKKKARTKIHARGNQSVVYIDANIINLFLSLFICFFF